MKLAAGDAFDRLECIVLDFRGLIIEPGRNPDMPVRALEHYHSHDCDIAARGAMLRWDKSQRSCQACLKRGRIADVFQPRRAGALETSGFTTLISSPAAKPMILVENLGEACE
jgi:hypothetical protein